jgi:hypothetical protein
MPHTADAVASSLLASFEGAKRFEQPYRHWLLTACLDPASATAVNVLPFEAPALGGVSGRREIHNNTRKYFDAENQAAFPVIAAVSEAFQSPRITRTVERTFGTTLSGTYLRIEYAQDTDGFWLEPHTDLGVKLFTLLLYVSDDPRHLDLGTDIYDTAKAHVGRSPFLPNSAMVFVPSDITYHGFEPRKIEGVRKSIIVNYVTSDWRAREQLSFPSQPIEH